VQSIQFHVLENSALLECNFCNWSAGVSLILGYVYRNADMLFITQDLQTSFFPLIISGEYGFPFLCSIQLDQPDTSSLPD